VLAEFEAAHALAAELQRIVDDTGEEDEAAAQQQQQSQQHSQQHIPTQRQLWVDKYAPHGFLSLLSEPRINREIAAWVAKWGKHQQQQGQQQQTAGVLGGQSAKQQQQQQKAEGPAAGRGRGDGGGRGGGAGGRGRGREGGKAEGAAAAGFVRGFDAARYQAAKEARAASQVLLLVGPPGGCRHWCLLATSNAHCRSAACAHAHARAAADAATARCMSGGVLVAEVGLADSRVSTCMH
jgi:hypothetical protein